MPSFQPRCSLQPAASEMGVSSCEPVSCHKPCLWFFNGKDLEVWSYVCVCVCVCWRGDQFCRLKTTLLLFADDVVLMASSVCDLQHTLDRFTAECEAAGMRISTSKSKAMVLSRKWVDCPLRVGIESSPQMKELVSGSCSQLRGLWGRRLAGVLV